MHLGQKFWGTPHPILVLIIFYFHFSAATYQARANLFYAKLNKFLMNFFNFFLSYSLLFLC